MLLNISNLSAELCWLETHWIFDANCKKVSEIRRPYLSKKICQKGCVPFTHFTSILLSFENLGFTPLLFNKDQDVGNTNGLSPPAFVNHPNEKVSLAIILSTSWVCYPRPHDRHDRNCQHYSY